MSGPCLSAEPLMSTHRDPRPPAWPSTASLLAGAPAHVDRFYLAYIIFFLLGIGMLFPWNVFITATEFYRFRFQQSVFSDNFSNWFGLAYNLANIVGLTVLLRVAHRVSIKQRVYAGLFIGLAVFVVTTAMVYVTAIGPTEYFVFTLMCIVVCGVVTALLQNGVFGLSSKFPATYTASVMTGQSLAGAVVSLAQILTTLVKTPDQEPVLAEEQLAALLYFLVAVVILSLCVVGFVLLTQLPFYSHYSGYHRLLPGDDEDEGEGAGDDKPQYEKGGRAYREAEDDSADDDRGSGNAVRPVNGPDDSSAGTSWELTQRVFSLGFSVFYVFVVTLGLFPSVVAAVAPVTTGSPSRIYDDIFVPFAFLLFNVGDVVGRALADVAALIPPRHLWIASLVRSVFFPLMLLSNVQLYDIGGQPIELALPSPLASDWAWWLIVLVFGVSSGYIASLAMMYGPQQVRPAERERTGIVMVNFLVWGLFAGSMTSFLLRGVLCSCNPFLE